MSHRNLCTQLPLLALILCVSPLTGCGLLIASQMKIPAAFNPVEGPLAAQRPRPSYMAHINGLLSGNVVVPMENGEVLKGTWHLIRPEDAASASTPDLSRDWDFVYGDGYYRAHVLGTRRYARAFLVGPAGSTAVVEFCNENNLPGETRGIAHDSHDNVFKVTVYN
jgi:hypothetical protein